MIFSLGQHKNINCQRTYSSMTYLVKFISLTASLIYASNHPTESVSVFVILHEGICCQFLPSPSYFTYVLNGFHHTSFNQFLKFNQGLMCADPSSDHVTVFLHLFHLEIMLFIFLYLILWVVNDNIYWYYMRRYLIRDSKHVPPDWPWPTTDS